MNDPKYYVGEHYTEGDYPDEVLPDNDLRHIPSQCRITGPNYNPIPLTRAEMGLKKLKPSETDWNDLERCKPKRQAMFLVYGETANGKPFEEPWLFIYKNRNKGFFAGGFEGDKVFKWREM